MEAIDECESTRGPIANIVKAGIIKHDRGRQEIKEAIEDTGVQELPRLEKNIGILATIAHIAPLLGLLGTVVGIWDVCKQAGIEKIGIATTYEE